ncbi:recombinase family protein [Palleronia sp.]|uniref:recombinase family protein n=1 Tax=Palleronia sp. TaxID=1940284 RepID=UPI0035C824CE
MIAALYLRSATQNDDAIAAQQRICAEYAAAQGWRVGEVFVDDGFSGTLDDRPGLVALRDSLQERRASIVIAEDASRLFRDINKLGEFYGFCDALSVEVSYARSRASSFDLLRSVSMEEIAERQRLAAKGLTT